MAIQGTFPLGINILPLYGSLGSIIDALAMRGPQPDRVWGLWWAIPGLAMPCCGLFATVRTQNCSPGSSGVSSKRGRLAGRGSRIMTEMTSLLSSIGHQVVAIVYAVFACFLVSRGSRTRV